MKLEEGKYYLRTDGEKVGPAINTNNGGVHPWNVPHKNGDAFYYENGVVCVESLEDTFNLIAEWQDETTTYCDDYASLAANHGIKITVQVGEVIVEYDGRK